MNYNELYKKIKSLSSEQRQLLKGQLKHVITEKNNKNNAPQQIVAYVIQKKSDESNELKSHLKNKLPEYMIPNHIIPMEAFPKLPNGKIDLNAFPSHNSNNALTSPSSTNHQNSLKGKLIAIWEEVLNYSPAKLEDNFFEVGGDSIRSIQIVAKARKQGITLTPNQLFEQPTISEILNAIAPKEKIEEKENHSTIHLQNKLIAIWEEVLNYSPAKLEDNFFEVGGDSIRSIQIVAKARKQGITLTPNQLFEQPTIAEILNAIAPKEKIEEKENNSTIHLQNKLIAIWEEVLNYSPAKLDDNFFEVGGDSIRSIQIVAKARKQGISLTPNQLFEQPTIAKLIQNINTATSSNTFTKEKNGTVALSPIQHWFFENHKAAPHHWNHIVEFEVSTQYDSHIFQKAIQTLVARHEGLRLSFSKTNNEWNPKILEASQLDIFHQYSVAQLPAHEQEVAIKKHIADIQSNFKLEKGSLFRGIFFELGNRQHNKWILTAHHLVTDHSSWRIIVDELSTICEQLQNGNEIELSPIATSYQDWIQYATSDSRLDNFKNDVAYWNALPIQKDIFPKDFEGQLPTPEKNSAVLISELDANSTKLLSEKSQKENLSSKDILIAAFAKSLMDWAATTSITIGLEGHGRNSQNGEIDLFNTIGWFTSYFPVHLEIDNDADLGQLMLSTKSQLQKTPNQGDSYGALRYLLGEKKLQHRPLFIFNFWGDWLDLETKVLQKFKIVEEHAVADASEKYNLIELNIFKQKGQFHFKWIYSNLLFKKETIQTLIGSFEKILVDFISHNVMSDGHNYSASDFPEADLSQSDLENLLNELE